MSREMWISYVDPILGPTKFYFLEDEFEKVISDLPSEVQRELREKFNRVRASCRQEEYDPDDQYDDYDPGEEDDRGFDPDDDDLDLNWNPDEGRMYEERDPHWDD